jgi:hypothetical protein
MMQEMMPYLGVYSREWVIEEYDTGSGVCGASETDTLALPARESHSALADFRAVVSAYVSSQRRGTAS